MTITTTVTMPLTQRPANMVEWIGLITSAIKELRGEEWYLDSTFTHKDVLTAINNDKAFYTTLTNSIATKLNSSSYTAADVLAKLITVDGSGSGLDADYVRGYVPVNKAGDTMTGFLTLSADPSANLHAATKQYVDNALQGFSIKKSVRALSDVSVTLSGLQTIDGVTLVAGDRVLLINQATRSENGIYDVGSGAWTRSNDAVGNDFKNGAAVFVLEGTNYADSGWVMTTDGTITVGTTALEWSKFSGAGQIIPENGLYKTGNRMGLTNTGISAGTYKSVTVDNMGRVTAGTNPTTLSGYGITDALNLAGGTMTGSITFTPDQTGLIWNRNTDGASIKFYSTSDAATDTRLEFNIRDNFNEYFRWTAYSPTTTTDVEAMKLMPDGSLSVVKSVTSPSFVGALTGNADTSSKWATARTITLTGAVTGSVSIDGSGNVSLATTYKDSGVVAGTYTKVTVDAKGNVTSGTTLVASDIPSLDWSKITTGTPTTLTGYGITDAVNVSSTVTTATANKLLYLDANAKLPASITGNADGNAATASKWLTGRTVNLTGDVTGTFTIDGSGDVSFATTYKNSGVTAGTYTKVTTDARGVVTAGTTLSASDIPNLDWSKITSGKPTTVNGYGITDAMYDNAAYSGSTMNVYEQITAYKNSVANVTGTMKITLPQGWTSTMMSIEIQGYDYTSKGAYSLLLGGYNYNTTTPVWNNTSAVIIGSAPFSSVRFGYDGSKVCILLGTTSTVWQYPELYISKFIASHQNYALDWRVGWSMAMITDESAITSIVTPTVNAGFRTEFADKITTARTFSWTGDVTGSVSFNGSANVTNAMTLATVNSNVGTFTKVTVNAKGLVTAATNLVAADIPNLDWSKITTGKPTTLSGYGITDAAPLVHDHPEFVKLDGTRPMTGQLTLAADPTDPMHAANKRYVDGLIQGIKARTAVDVATTANITLTASQVIDGITVTSGMRVLVKNQTTASQNGIYIAADGAWTRAPEYDESTEFDGSVFVFVDKGTANGDTGWVLDADTTVTIGTTAITFIQFSRAGVTEGDNTTIVRNGNIISLKTGIVTAGTYTKLTVDTYGRVTAGTTLVATDIPNLDWTKITTGKPTTIAGYGITDAAPLTHTTVLASASTLGHVKIGNGISVSGIDGTISANVDGTSIVLSGTSPNQVIAHAKTSTQASVTNSTNTVIQSVALDGMGHVTSISSKTMTYSDVGAVPTTDTATTATANKLLYLDANSKLPASITGNADGNAATATKLQTARTFSWTGDATGTLTFDGTANVSAGLTLATTGVAAGTYRSVTVDTKGRVTAATNPTTAAGYGLTDVKLTDGSSNYSSAVTTVSDVGRYFRFATMSLTAQNGFANTTILVLGKHGYNNASIYKAVLDFRVRQSTSLGSVPLYTFSMTERSSFASNGDFMGIITDNTASLTKIDLYMKIPQGNDSYSFTPLANNSGNTAVLTFTSNETFVSSASLPAGTQFSPTDLTLTTHSAVIANNTTLGHIKTGDGMQTDGTGAAYVDTGDGITLSGTSPNKKVQANVDGTTIILSGSSPNKVIAHAITSTQASITNTGATVIQSVGVDGMGHVTSMTSKTLSYTDVGAVPTTDVVTTATANKILKLDSNSKLPASITGDSATVGGITPGNIVRKDVANNNTTLQVSNGTYADPDPANSYAVKASGGVSTDKINIGGKINLQYNATENSLDIVFL